MNFRTFFGEIQRFLGTEKSFFGYFQTKLGTNLKALNNVSNEFLIEI